MDAREKATKLSMNAAESTSAFGQLEARLEAKLPEKLEKPRPPLPPAPSALSSIDGASARE